MNLNISEYIRIYKNTPEYIRIYQNISEYFKIYQNTSGWLWKVGLVGLIHLGLVSDGLGKSGGSDWD